MFLINFLMLRNYVSNNWLDLKVFASISLFYYYYFFVRFYKTFRAFKTQGCRIKILDRTFDLYVTTSGLFNLWLKGCLELIFYMQTVIFTLLLFTHRWSMLLLQRGGSCEHPHAAIQVTPDFHYSRWLAANGTVDWTLGVQIEIGAYLPKQHKSQSEQGEKESLDPCFTSFFLSNHTKSMMCHIYYKCFQNFLFLGEINSQWKENR